jgi:hypothetical protein
MSLCKMVFAYSKLGKAAGMFPAAFINSWLPTLDNLRNFLLTTTSEVLSFLQQLQKAY